MSSTAPSVGSLSTGKSLTWAFPEAPASASFPGFEQACRHYPPTDFPLFCLGYGELCREDLSGKVAIEMACGRGDLAVCLASRFPKARIIAVDRYPEAGAAIREAHSRGEVPNLEYHCGDALDLTFAANNSANLVFGQAALHHLAHNMAALSAESYRVLAPGGRLLFLFEPLGHNWIVSCVRAIQISRHQMCDESNLFESVFREILRNFSRCEVQAFNLSGYFLKGLKGNFAVRSARLANKFDRLFGKLSKKAPLFGANANVIFYK